MHDAMWHTTEHATYKNGMKEGVRWDKVKVLPTHHTIHANEMWK